MTYAGKNPTRGDRFRYWLDDYMSRGSRSSFTALLLGFVVALVVIAAIRSHPKATGGDFWPSMSIVLAGGIGDPVSAAFAAALAAKA